MSLDVQRCFAEYDRTWRVYGGRRARVATRPPRQRCQGEEFPPISSVFPGMRWSRAAQKFHVRRVQAEALRVRENVPWDRRPPSRDAMGDIDRRDAAFLRLMLHLFGQIVAAD